VLNPPSKENPATSARHYPQHRLLKIVVQAAALLPYSEIGGIQLPFFLKMYPGPNTVLFFTPQTLIRSPDFYPYGPVSFPSFRKTRLKGGAV
jgi:hypothetical protein